jgi:hypothetical protein
VVSLFFEEDGPKVAEKGLISNVERLSQITIDLFEVLLVLVTQLICKLISQALLIAIHVHIPTTLETSNRFSDLFPKFLQMPCRSFSNKIVSVSAEQ